MSKSYFSERATGPSPRATEEIELPVWSGIWALITQCLRKYDFAQTFPDHCPDDESFIVGHCPELLEASAHGAGIVWPIRKDDAPDTLAILDLLEFCHEHVTRANVASRHTYFRHDHLIFEIGASEVAKTEFREAVNQLLARGKVAFEMKSDGQIVRLGTPELAPVLKDAVFKTGEPILDELLEDALAKFAHRDLKIRKESLEKIWDAFERLKTIEEPEKDKKASSTALLAKAIQENPMREQIEKEMRLLTDIGNNFMIRHAELNKIPINRTEEVDYLFQRMFGLMRLLLRGTGRGG